MSNSDSPKAPVANQARLEALGRAVEGRRGRPPKAKRAKRAKRSKLKIGLISVASLLVVVLVAIAADYYYINGLVHRVNVKNESVTYNNTENILLVGSTTRCGLTTQNPAYGLCSAGVTGVNSDVVMILHLNLTTRQISILSIPRDLFVPNARITGANKIDAALYNGPSQLVAAIQEDFGIPINHYVELNFDTFASVVNVLGGINMYFPMEIFDAYSGLNIRHPGCIHLNGIEALQVVRARHLQVRMKGDSQIHSTWPQEALSDLARIRRDHEFLKVLGTAVKAKGISNPITDQRLATSIAPYLTVDSAFSTTDMLSLGEHFANVSIGSVPELTVPVVLLQSGPYIYQGYSYGDVEFPIEPGIDTTIHRFLNLGSSINTMTGRALPKANTVSVSVVNGTGVANQAASVAAGLRAHGLRVTSETNATPVGIQSETVVYHANNTPASLGAAQTVLRNISGPAVMALGPTVGGAQVTVLTGSDITVVAVPPKSTTTTLKTKKGGPTTTTSVLPTTTIHDPSLSSPTPVTQALQPWDPRSCGPNNTPGP
ncbi:MAG: LCP family protein [Acidimicrobiaceae bacterium]|nr:LCP family protein [Acidimicrobiaceae bacterium]